MSFVFTSAAYIQVHFKLDFNMNPDQIRLLIAWKQSDLGPYYLQSRLEERGGSVVE